MGESTATPLHVTPYGPTMGGERLDGMSFAADPIRTAGVAQLVEHNVANVVVVGSNPITRSS